MDHSISLFEPLLDAKAVAQILGIHPQTVLRLARTGKLPGLRYARHWRFRTTDIAKWIDAQIPIEQPASTLA
jgi:excisionase family DNA binding protein